MSQCTFAIGDIHGCIEPLKRLMTECRTYADGSELRFVFLGDYVDRGPDSRAVISLLREEQERFGREAFVCLMGNHEDMLLQSITDAETRNVWLAHCSAVTLASFGVQKPEDIPSVHLEWMRSLPVFFDDGLRFFVHAGINPGRPLREQSRTTMLWSRPNEFAGEDWTNWPGVDRLIVHGHTPHASPEIKPGRINVDTGAVFGGALTAAVFEDHTTLPVAFITHHGEVTHVGKAAHG